MGKMSFEEAYKEILLEDEAKKKGNMSFEEAHKEILLEDQAKKEGTMSFEEAYREILLEDQMAEAPSTGLIGNITETPNTLERDHGNAMNVSFRGAELAAPEPKPLPKGLITEGNLDLNKRPVVPRDDGKISTVDSITVGFDDGFYVIPRVTEEGLLLDNNQAVEHFKKTGKHLGRFYDQETADAFAQQLHLDQEKMYGGQGEANGILNSIWNGVNRYGGEFLAAMNSALWNASAGQARVISEVAPDVDYGGILGGIGGVGATARGEAPDTERTNLVKGIDDWVQSSIAGFMPRDQTKLDEIIQGFGSAAGYYAPGLAFNKLFGAAATALRSPEAVNMISALTRHGSGLAPSSLYSLQQAQASANALSRATVGISGGVMEGLSEAVGVFDDAIKNGMSKEDAFIASMKNAITNIPIASIANMAGAFGEHKAFNSALLKMMDKVGLIKRIGLDRAMKAVDFFTRTISGGVSELVQESEQGLSSEKFSTGKPWSEILTLENIKKKGKDQGVVGGIVGSTLAALLGGGGVNIDSGLAQRLIEKYAENDAEVGGAEEVVNYLKSLGIDVNLLDQFSAGQTDVAPSQTPPTDGGGGGILETLVNNLKETNPQMAQDVQDASGMLTPEQISETAGILEELTGGSQGLDAYFGDKRDPTVPGAPVGPDGKPSIATARKWQEIVEAAEAPAEEVEEAKPVELKKDGQAVAPKKPDGPDDPDNVSGGGAGGEIDEAIDPTINEQAEAIVEASPEGQRIVEEKPLLDQAREALANGDVQTALGILQSLGAIPPQGASVAQGAAPAIAPITDAPEVSPLVEPAVEAQQEVVETPTEEPQARSFVDRVDSAIDDRARGNEFLKIGQEVLPDLRMADQEEAGQWAYLVEKGEVAQADFDAKIEEWRRENRFTTPKGTQVPENVTQEGQETHIVRYREEGELKEAPVTYDIVEADTLITSKDDGYPQELQPRDTDRSSSEARVGKMAANLKPELLGFDDFADRGAPTTDANGVVVAGNHRTWGIQRAYATKKGHEYKKFLVEKIAKKLGIDPEVVKKMKNPVLRRRIDDPNVNLKAFAQDANISVVGDMSASEQARADAENLTPTMLSMFETNNRGEISSRDFVEAFVRANVRDTELGKFADKNGNLSQDGIRRIKNAIVAKAYGDADLVGRISESTDDNMKRVSTGMMQGAPAIAKMEEKISKGLLQPLSIRGDVMKAIEIVNSARSNGRSVSEYLNGQVEMFAESPISDTTRMIAEFFASPRTSAKAVRDFLNGYAQAVERLGSPQEQMIPGLGVEVPSTAELVERVLAMGKDQEAETGNLFDQAEEVEKDEVKKVKDEIRGKTKAEIKAEYGDEIAGTKGLDATAKKIVEKRQTEEEQTQTEKPSTKYRVDDDGLDSSKLTEFEDETQEENPSEPAKEQSKPEPAKENTKTEDGSPSAETVDLNKKITFSTLKKAFPKEKVYNLGNGVFRIVGRNGQTAHLVLAKRVDIDPVAYERENGKPPTQEMLDAGALGSTTLLVDGTSLIQIAADMTMTAENVNERLVSNNTIITRATEMARTIFHESYHVASDMVLSKKEKALLTEKYGSEEAQADAYMDWLLNRESKSTVGRIFQRIYDFFSTVRAGILGPNSESVFVNINRGNAWSREANEVASGEKAGPSYRVKADPAAYEASMADLKNSVSLASVMKTAGSQKWGTNVDFMYALEKEIRPKLEAVGVDYDSTYDKKDTDPAYQKLKAYLVDVATADALEAIQTNKNAIGWYDEKTSQALGIMSTIYPELATDPNAKFAFTVALAVTSNGQKVNKNFELARKAYEEYKGTGKMPTDIGIGTTKGSINQGLKVFNTLVDKYGIDDTRRILTTRFTVGQLKSIGIEVKGELVDQWVIGGATLGPKVGNGFFANLNKFFDALTMDRWFMRSWGRWTGKLFSTDQSKQMGSEARLGRSVSDILSKIEADVKADIESGKFKLSGNTEKARDKSFLEEVRRRSNEFLSSVIGPKRAQSIDLISVKEEIDSNEGKERRHHKTDLSHNLAKAIKGASVKKEARDAMRDSYGGDEFRKAGNNLAGNINEEKQAPDNGSERKFIRDVFTDVLANLRDQGYNDLTMADLQAVFWYAERKVYESAKAKEVSESYEDDEAPDYANAAEKLAQSLGVPQEEIARAKEEAKNVNSTADAGGSNRGNDRENGKGDRGGKGTAQTTPEGFLERERRRFIQRNIFSKQYLEHVRTQKGKRSGGGRDGDVWVHKRRSDRGDRSLRGLEIEATYTPTATLEKILDLSEISHPTVHELAKSPENAKAFREAITEAKNSDLKFGAAVYVYDQSAYEGMRLFLTDDGKHGFAIKGDGDIVSVFSAKNKDKKKFDAKDKDTWSGVANWFLTVAASEGGTKLDCYDTVLPKIYKLNGFREVRRDKWDESQVLPDWNKETFKKYNNGEPDVVYMEYDPTYDPYAEQGEQSTTRYRISDREYLSAVEAGDMETAQRMVDEAAEESGLPILDDSAVTAYKVRRTAPPQKSVKAYKLFKTKKNQPGQIFPLFVGATDPLPQGGWLDAEIGPEAKPSKTGKPQVKSKLGPLAFRPGWHSSDLPLATHIGVKGTDGKIFARANNEVWAEVEMAADVDYQPEADANGRTKSGSFSATLADIKHMPVDGYYRYKTNPNMTGSWIISGSMKINRILSEAEVNSILTENGAKPMPWEGGPLDLGSMGLATEAVKNVSKILDPVTYDDHGNVIPLSQRFDPDTPDIRYRVSTADTLDAEYLAAVEAGDMEAAQKLVDEAAKNASVVLGERGFPKKFYHGSQSTFNIFDKTKKGKNKIPGEIESNKSFWLAENKTVGIKFANGGLWGHPTILERGSVLYSTYAIVKNPLIVDMDAVQLSKENKAWDVRVDNKTLHEIGFVKEQVVRKAKKEGRDGVIFRNGYDGIAKEGDIIAVFDPSQIKSADPIVKDDQGNVIPLSERFNSKESDIRYRVAYHGSPHRFTEFSTEYIGTGERAQVFGWGLYFTEKRGIAEDYREKLQKRNFTYAIRTDFGVARRDDAGNWDFVNDDNIDDPVWVTDPIEELSYEFMMENNFDEKRALRKIDEFLKDPKESTGTILDDLSEGELDLVKGMKDFIESIAMEKAEPGQLYEVEIPDDDSLLYWDKPLNEQPEDVQDALKGALESIDQELLQRRFHELSAINGHFHDPEYTYDNLEGQEIYSILSGALRGDDQASELLNSLGVNGIKYLDGNSREKGEGTHNFVVFDDEAIEVVKTHYRMRPGMVESKTPVTGDDLKRSVPGAKVFDMGKIPVMKLRNGKYLAVDPTGEIPMGMDVSLAEIGEDANTGSIDSNSVMAIDGNHFLTLIDGMTRGSEIPEGLYEIGRSSALSVEQYNKLDQLIGAPAPQAGMYREFLATGKTPNGEITKIFNSIKDFYSTIKTKIFGRRGSAVFDRIGSREGGYQGGTKYRVGGATQSQQWKQAVAGLNMEEVVEPTRTSQTLKDKMHAAWRWWKREVIDDISGIHDYFGKDIYIKATNAIHGINSRAEGLIRFGEKAKGVKSLSDIFSRVPENEQDGFMHFVVYTHMLDIARNTENAMAAANQLDVLAKEEMDKARAFLKTVPADQSELTTLRRNARLHEKIADEYRRQAEEARKQIHETRAKADDYQMAVDNLRKAYSHWEQAQRDLTKFNRFLLWKLKKAGIISSSLHDTLVTRYPNYVPLQRDFGEEAGFESFVRTGGIVNLANPLKKLKGSSRDVKDPLLQIISNVYAFEGLLGKQEAGQDIASMADNGQLAGLVDPIAESERTGLPGEYVFHVWENGKKKYYKTDQDIYTALVMSSKGAGTGGFATLLKVLSIPVRVLRAGVTHGVGFILRNPMRDTVNAGMVGDHFTPIMTTLKGAFSILSKKDGWFEEFVKSGASQGVAYLSPKTKAELARSIRMGTGKTRILNELKNPPRALWRLLGEMAQFTELATRVGQYRVSRERGTGMGKAAYEARDLLNYQRGGRVSRAISKVNPFFNAQIQGVAKGLRSMYHDGKVDAKSLARGMLYITMPSMLVTLWNYGDDDRRKKYLSIPAWQRNLFWNIVVGEGDDAWILKLPKPFDLGLLFGSIPERAMDYLYADDKKAFDDLGKSVLDAVSPEWGPLFMTLPLELATNYSFFRGGNIVPMSQERLDPRLQYGPYTAEWAKWAGERFGLSPRKLEYAVNNITGNLGKEVSDLTDKVFRTMSNETRPAREWYQEVPGVSAFAVPAKAMKRWEQTFRDDREELETAYRSAKEMLKTTPWKELSREDQNILKMETAVKHVGKYFSGKGGISDLYSEINRITMLKGMSASEKRERVQKLEKRIHNISVRGIKDIDTIRERLKGSKR